MKDDRVYLLHIRDCLERIAHYTLDGRDAFFADTKTQDAVIRNFEVIGEAVKNLSQTYKNAHPDVPWKRIAGLRDLLIHRYFGVKLDTVWKVIEEKEAWAGSSHSIPAISLRFWKENPNIGQGKGKTISYQYSFNDPSFNAHWEILYDW